MGPTTGAAWSGVIDRGLRWMFVVPVSLSLLAYLPSGLAEWRRLGPVGEAGVLVVLLVQIVVVASAIRGGGGDERQWLARVLGLGCLIGLVLILLGQPPGPWHVTWWPTTAANAVLCYALVFGGRHRRLTGIVLMIAFWGVRLIAIFGSGESLRLVLAEAVSGLQLAWTVVLAVEALRRVGTAIDTSLMERRRLLHSEELGRVQRRQSRAVERFLHDEVLHTLRAVAHPRRIGEAPVRDAAARTVRLLTRSRELSEEVLLSGVGELQREVRVRIEQVGRPPELPTLVEHAFAGAIREAIRNADRHSGADTVQVSWQQTGRRVEAVISDAGRGFDPTSVGKGGISSSIAEPMAEVGGWSQITSDTSGTRVVLGWRTPDPSKAVLSRTWQRLRRGAVVAMIPMLLGNVAMLTLLAVDLERAWPAALGVLVVSALGGWSGWAVWHGSAGISVAVLVPLGCVLVLFLNTASIDPSASNAFLFLLAGGVIPVMMPLLVVYPVSVGLVQTLVIWAGIVCAGWWRFGLAHTLDHYVGAMTAPTLLLAILWLRLVVGVLGRRLLSELDRLDAAEIRTHELEVHNRVREARLRRVSQRTAPFLAGVAAGRLALGDPATERWARQLELEVRDEVQFGGPSPALASRLAAVRQRGWLLELRLDRLDVSQLEPRLLRLLVAFDREPWSDKPVVVSNLGELVAVVADEWSGDPPDERLVRLENGDGFCTLRPSPTIG